jgi:hypothetical protein
MSTWIGQFLSQHNDKNTAVLLYQQPYTYSATVRRVRKEEDIMLGLSVVWAVANKYERRKKGHALTLHTCMVSFFLFNNNTLAECGLHLFHGPIVNIVVHKLEHDESGNVFRKRPQFSKVHCLIRRR